MPFVPTYRISEAAALLGLSDDTLRRWVDAGRLPASPDGAGRLTVQGRDLAAVAAALAHDTELAPTVAVSARNRFPGIVTRVIADEVVAQVEVQAGPHRVVSLMTREAAEELGLEPGVRAVATVKATTVVVELPGGAA
jgi:molybdopterin-binding protein